MDISCVCYISVNVDLYGGSVTLHPDFYLQTTCHYTNQKPKSLLNYYTGILDFGCSYNSISSGYEISNNYSIRGIYRYSCQVFQHLLMLY